MPRQAPDALELTITDMATRPAEDGYQPVDISTSRGVVQCRYYPAEGTTRGAIWVGGAGGGWDTPARGLYPSLAAELTSEGIASLRVRFRNPHQLGEATLDVLAGIEFLTRQSIDRVALTGHSFGGAVIIQAAANEPVVRTIIALAPQSYGAHPIRDLGEQASLLAMHGTHDTILPHGCSEQICAMATGHKQLVLLPRAGHVLDEAADEVYTTVKDWIVAELSQG